MHKIWIIAATQPEIHPFIDGAKPAFIRQNANRFDHTGGKVAVLITGVGMYNTLFAMMDALTVEKPDLILNVGIAGSFRKDISLGDVVTVREDRFADIGAEEKDGTFISIFDMGFEGPDTAPFTGGKLLSGNFGFFENLRTVSAITVNKVHGNEKSIQAIQKLYDPDIESMEGAAVMFTALKKGIPVVQLRSISNYVTPRNKEEWKIGLAIQNLNDVLSGWLKEYI